MAVSAPPDLWKTAIDSVELQVKDRLAPTKTLVRDVVYEVLKEAKARHNDSVKKRLRLPNGIIVRDVMEKIIHWVNCFKEVGDNAVQFDPGHAALPWAAVRFILQGLVNYSEVEREILEEIELIARLLTIFRGIEKFYLGPDAMVELQDALVRAYTAILETLANAVRLLSESKKAKLLKAPFRVPDKKNINRLLAHEHEVFSFTQLVDGDRVSQMMVKLERLTERSTITDIAVENQKHRSVLEWLSKTNYRDHHRDLSGMRLTGTGDWLLQNAEYVSWQQRSSCSTLILHGIPGCGKTILCSTVIDELIQSSLSTQRSSTQVRAPVAYFYCSAITSEPDRRDFTNILRSLLRQLTIGSSQIQRIHSAVLAAYDARLEEAKKEGFDIRLLDAAECETMILNILEDNPATFIIDAIDEMDDPQGLLHSLQTICSKSKNVLKVLVSSRDNPLILSTSSAAHHIRVTTKDNHSDVHRFITQRVDELTQRRKIPQGMRDETILSLSTRAGEMFQWAKLQLAQLEFSQDPLIGEDFREKLSELAALTLEGLYGTIFGAIMRYKETARQMAIHTFSWLLFACEPLNMDMLLAATANAAGWENPTAQGCLEICRGFVYVDSQSNIVRLVHESVREFLLSQSLLQTRQSQTLISLSCLKILESPPPDDVTQLHPADEPYDYATLYIGQHLSLAGSDSVSDTFLRKLETFLFDGDDISVYADIWLTTVKATCGALPHDHPQKVAMGVIVSDSCLPIFPICAFGLLSVLRTHHWPPGFDWNQVNSHNHTALYLAANFGHAAVVSFLLDQLADPNIKCGIFGTALQCAAYRGHDTVVEILADRGADLKLQGKFESVLHAACNGGHERVAMKLLDSRLKFTTQSEYDIATAEVARAGFARALDKLQAHPLSKTLTSEKIQQQARAAIISGKLAVLKRLISRSTFDLVVTKGSLASSAVHGHEDIAELLIANGVDIDEPGPLGTPLRCASVCGHNSVCRLLLDHGANIDANAQFGPALHAAAMRGHLHTAKFLLDNGADVNAQGGHYGTPMQAAAYHGHVELVNLFLDAKADILIPGLFRDAFRAAIEGGREDVVATFAKAGLQGLTANAIGYRSVEFCSAGPGIPVLPPRNILRDSSPSRHFAETAAITKWYDSLSDSEDDIDERKDGTNLGFDPFDPSHAPRPHKTRRGPGRQRPQHPKQDMLETSAALGHFTVVRALLLEGRMFREAEIALVAACRHGQRDVVCDLLESIPIESDCMRKAFAAASICHDDEITQILMSALDKLEGQEIVQFLPELLLSCVPDNPFLFGHTLRRVLADASEHFVESTLLSCLCVVAEAGWSRDLKIIIERLNLTTENIVTAFEAAFDAGHAATVSMLQNLLTEDMMTVQQYNGFARLAVQAGHTELFECMLPRTDFSDATHYVEHMIYCAAGSGHLRILTTLTSQDWALFYSKEALTKALLIAARNGHYDVATYLVSMGAEVFQSVIEPRDEDILERKASIYRYLCNSKKSSSKKYSRQRHKGNAGQSRQFLGPNRDAIERRADPVSESRCNAIEACLAGYERFSVYHHALEDSILPWQLTDDIASSPWQLADEPVHARTITMLFDHCADFEGPQWTDVVCKAFAICSPDLLDLMLAKGADPHAANETTSALICAAGRSTSTLAAVQALVSAANDTAFGEAELRTALDAAISLFHESKPERAMYHDYYGSTLFPMYDKVEDIFVSGPGAVIKYVLHLIPQETARGDRYSLCLQMAAAADNYDIVRLLLERGADCNAVVGYYGTALKAACRLGHSAIVALLLDFGADHTIADGEAFHTALQAAVIAHSLSCVRALLNHGANTKLTMSTRDWSHYGLPRASPLSLAIDARLASISVLLIKAGAYTNEESSLEQPSLIRACSWGETIVVRSLLQSGADVRVLGTKDHFTEIIPRQYGSALHAAIEFGHIHLVELLVAHGLELTADCGTAGYPLEYAAAKGDISVMATLLKLCPLNSGKPFVEAVQSAILHSHQEMVKLICDYARCALTAHDLLLLCKSPNSSSECSIIWFLLERLRQLNGSAGQFAEAVRHVMRHEQPATALQLFTHAEKFLLSREIWNVLLEQGRLWSSRQFVLLLIETLQGRHDFDLELELASADITGVRPEHVETLLSYVQCTHAIFIEACTRGDEKVVRIGLSQGLTIDDGVGMQRPALHFAAAHGRTEIVKMLLKERPASSGNHKEYGTPMEAVLMSCAASSLLLGESLCEKEARYLQDLTKLDKTDYSTLFIHDPQRDAARNEIVRSLLVHRSHACSSESASGSTLLELSLALYLGRHDVFRQLLVQGTPVQSCRSVLPSPLVVAIESHYANSLEMVKEMLELDKSSPGISWYDPEGCALHQACRHKNVPIVEMLFARGYSSAHKNREGQSSLTVCLDKVAQALRYHYSASKILTIAHTLLERDAAASVSDEDIVAACDVPVGPEQNAILRTLFARWKPFYIPEEGMIRLLSAKLPRDGILDEVLPWQKILDEERIEKVTTNLFAGVDRVEVLTKLLDYDQSYVVGAETIDLVGTRSRRRCSQSVVDCIGKLLDRCPNLLPTGSNVLRVLQDAGSYYDASSILDLLFSRNPALNVTEQMLKDCRNPVNLSLLLSREKTGEAGLVLSLMDSLVEESEDLTFGETCEIPARFAVLLDHAPRAKLSSRVIECIMGSSHSGNIGRVLDRHPDASLTGDNISAMIEAPRKVAVHRDVVDFLRKYHGRYSMSDVKVAVGRMNMLFKEEHLEAKKLYDDFAGW